MASSRRHLFYLLLFLVPTLAVGAGTLWLLHREQQRLDEQTRAAETARLAAIDARARLIAENLELVISDVETGLMAALSETPRENPEPYLANWRRTNPLVHNVCIATIEGRPRWGAPDTVTAQFIAAAPWREHGAPPATPREFMDAIASSKPTELQRLAATPVPEVTKETAKADLAAPSAQTATASETKDMKLDGNAALTDNVVQYQSARIALNQAANINIQSAPPSASHYKSGEPGKLAVNREQKKISERKTKYSARARMEASEVSIASIDEIAAATPALSAEESVETAPVAAAASPPAADTSSSLRATGWTPWTAPDGTLHLYGWRLTAPNRPVLVVEVNLAAIASRLGGFLPATLEPGEAFALRQHDNAILHQVGFSRRATPDADKKNASALDALKPSIVVPLAATLPAWNIAGYSLAAPLAPDSAASRTFFLLGALLVAAIIATILASGGLLWRQARLSAAESAQKTSFVANVSHEFKTPLTTIRLYSELLEQGRIRDDAKRAESLRTISRETQRLARLVNNVLDYSRLEQGRKKFDLAEYDLRDEIARILGRHAPRIAEAGLRIAQNIPDAPCPVKTDLDAVEQIIINLLDNACKYAAGGGEVMVRLETPDSGGTGILPVGSSSTGFQPVPVSVASKHGHDTHATRPHGQDARATQSIHITVADRGPGIPASHREKIFEKFHRVDDTLTAAQGGAGLGLSIARQLARALGGDLAYSPRPGGGSEFTLTLL